MRSFLMLLMFFYCANAFAVGVTYCKHGSFAAPCNTITSSDSDLSNNTFSDGSSANDNISSLKFTANLSAVVCKDANYMSTCAYFIGSPSGDTEISWAILNGLGLNDQISSIMILGLGIGGGSKTFGIPPYMDVSTMSIENYQDDECDPFFTGSPDLPFSHEGKNAFINSLEDEIDAGSYSTSVTVNQNFEDGNGTLANWQSFSSSSEWTTFHGHGGLVGLWMNDCLYADPDDHTFSGWNRYLLLDSCSVLSDYHPISHFIPMFGGLHALFGFVSEMIQFDYGAYESWDLEDGFMANWIGEELPLWEAWTDAVELHIVNHGEYDVETGSIYPRIYIRLNNGTGRWLNANYEYFEDMFNGSLPSRAGEFHKVTVTWGTPEY